MACCLLPVKRSLPRWLAGRRAVLNRSSCDSWISEFCFLRTLVYTWFSGAAETKWRKIDVFPGEENFKLLPSEVVICSTK